MPSRRFVLSGVATTLEVNVAGCNTVLQTSTEADETLVGVSNGETEIEAISYEHVDSVGDVRESVRLDGYTVAVTLTDDGIESFADALDTAGALEDQSDIEMRLYLDGELVSGGSTSPFVLDASGAQASHTGNTTETTLATIAVPGGAMGANGAIRISTLWSFSGSAGAKALPPARCAVQFVLPRRWPSRRTAAGA